MVVVVVEQKARKVMEGTRKERQGKAMNDNERRGKAMSHQSYHEPVHLSCILSCPHSRTRTHHHHYRNQRPQATMDNYQIPAPPKAERQLSFPLHSFSFSFPCRSLPFPSLLFLSLHVLTSPFISFPCIAFPFFLFLPLPSDPTPSHSTPQPPSSATRLVL